MSRGNNASGVYYWHFSSIFIEKSDELKGATVLKSIGQIARNPIYSFFLNIFKCKHLFRNRHTWFINSDLNFSRAFLLLCQMNRTFDIHDVYNIQTKQRVNLHSYSQCTYLQKIRMCDEHCHIKYQMVNSHSTFHMHSMFNICNWKAKIFRRCDTMMPMWKCNLISNRAQPQAKIAHCTQIIFQTINSSFKHLTIVYSLAFRRQLWKSVFFSFHIQVQHSKRENFHDCTNQRWMKSETQTRKCKRNTNIKTIKLFSNEIGFGISFRFKIFEY